MSRQAAIGWTNSHLHQFVTPQETYGMEIPGEDVFRERLHSHERYVFCSLRQTKGAGSL